MKVLILAAVWLIATAAAAQTTNPSSAPTKAAGSQDDPDQVICRSQDIPGTRRRQRVCHTRAEWAAMRSGEYRDRDLVREPDVRQQQTYTPY